MNKNRIECIYASVVALLVVAAVVIVALFYHAPRVEKNPLDELNLRLEESGLRDADPFFNDIKTLIDKPDYQKALARTEKELRHSEMELKELDDASYVWGDDEMKFEEEQMHMRSSELRWTYIHLLVRTEKNKDAIRELRRYIKAAEYASHLEEAEELLALLKKKK